MLPFYLEDWISEIQNRVLILEAHHTPHIEGARLTLGESEQLLKVRTPANADPEDAKELLNYRDASATPGEYRKIQNYVVASKIGETVYTPPPAYEVQRMMQHKRNWNVILK